MTLAQALEHVKTFFSAVFSVDSTNPGIATQLITWMTTSGHEIVMIPLYLYILVAIANVARRFIPGV